VHHIPPEAPAIAITRLACTGRIPVAAVDPHLLYRRTVAAMHDLHVDLIDDEAHLRVHVGGDNAPKPRGNPRIRAGRVLFEAVFAAAESGGAEIFVTVGASRLPTDASTDEVDRVLRYASAFASTVAAKAGFPEAGCW
jgi:hypothetical protein